MPKKLRESYSLRPTGLSDVTLLKFVSLTDDFVPRATLFICAVTLRPGSWVEGEILIFQTSKGNEPFGSRNRGEKIKCFTKPGNDF